MVQNLNDSIVWGTSARGSCCSAGTLRALLQPGAVTGLLLGAGEVHQRKIQELMPELEGRGTTLTEDESREVEVREIRRQDRVLEVTATRFNDGESRLKGWLLVVDDRTDRSTWKIACASKKTRGGGPVGGGHRPRDPEPFSHQHFRAAFNLARRRHRPTRRRGAAHAHHRPRDQSPERPDHRVPGVRAAEAGVELSGEPWT